MGSANQVPISNAGYYAPRHSAEFSGCGGRLMHHHLACLANSRFLFFSGCVGRVWFVAGQNSPGDPRRLVGHGDSSDAGGFAFEQ